MLLLAIAAACSTSLAPTGASTAKLPPLLGAPEPPVEEGSLRRVMMTRHNDERARWGLPPLGWDDDLVASAKAYSRDLASRRVIEHDVTVQGREGENLFRGTRDAFSYDQMVEEMFDERRDFRPGVFPQVSATGKWQDVAHFTQIIWPDTRKLGCAVTRGIFFDYLVCRYAPAGNVRGAPVGM